MAQYYVIRDKNTGLYFRGKGVNRWGKDYNQASIYRVKAMAKNTLKEVSWRGEQAEIVPIQIIETIEDVVPKGEVEEFAEEIKFEFYREFDEIIPSIMADKIDELKNKYLATDTNDGCKYTESEDKE